MYTDDYQYYVLWQEVEAPSLDNFCSNKIYIAKISHPKSLGS